jgi:hypothetical protein
MLDDLDGLDHRQKPRTLTLDVDDDELSLRLWFSWDDLSLSSRLALVEMVEHEAALEVAKQRHAVAIPA